MSHSYFRQEALAARQTRFAGSIVMRQPVPMRLAAGVSVVIGLLLAAYLGLAQYTRKVHVTGQIAPAAGALQAVATQGGRVVRVHAHDGDQVRQGQPLFDLSAERSSGGSGIDTRIGASLAERRRTIERELELQTAQLRERAGNLQSRARLNADEIERLDDEIKQQQRRCKRARDLLARHRKLRDKGFETEPQVAVAENEVGDQVTRLRALERTQRSAKAERLQIQDELAQLKTQGALYAEQAARNLASLDQELAEQQGRTGNQVLAPANGTLTAVAVEAGQTVTAGVTLGVVLPAGSELQARLIAPSSAIGFVEIGQQVKLRLAAFPYQKFGFVEGTVTRVDSAPMPSTTSQAGAGEPGYLIVVRLNRQALRAYGAERRFRAGMTVDADIQLDRRSLFEWILDPLISVRGGKAAADER